MDSSKFRKTVTVAIFVSLASQVRFNLLTDGFIVALSVMVMAIFIYCYEDLSALYIAFCSGIFAVLFRLLIMFIQHGHFVHMAELVMPDIAFFFTYGVIYTLIYKYIVRKPKNIRNFPLTIFICDISSNMAEMTARCIVFDRMIFTVTIITSLFVIAFVRTILTQMVIIAIEAYSNFLVNKEHDAEYKKLLTQASIFEGELHVMEKNLVEIEDIMKKAYELHQSMSHIDAPKELQDTSLEIAKNAHEVKGDYMSVIGVLKETYVGGFGDKGMSIHDIVALERANVLSLIRSRGYHIDVSMKIKADFRVTKSFKMMSIIRNLLTNSAEAIRERGGRISISVTEVLDKKNERTDSYAIVVYDNGPGIERESMEDVFLPWYTTKFDPETGQVNRGLGMSLLKDYVEDDFNGSIAIESEKNKFTRITITMPAETFEENKDEVLHS